MSDRENNPEPDTPLPKPGVRTGRRWSLSLIWLVPTVAALAGIVLVLRAWLASGPAITISFDSAEGLQAGSRSEEHTSELQSLMRISYAVFSLKKKTKRKNRDELDKNTTEAT